MSSVVGNQVATATQQPNQPVALSTKNKKGFTYQLTSFGKAFINAASKAARPVMDIGAAYGVASIPALKAGASVIAVDIEEQHLMAISEQLDNSLRNRLMTMRERFPHFNMPKHSLSAVYMSQVLPFLKGDEIEQGVRKIYDWLVPGGEVFVVSFTPYIQHVESFIPIYEERLRRGDKWGGYIDDLTNFSSDPDIYTQLPQQIHHIGMEDLKRVFEESGFVIKELRYFGEEEGPLPKGIRYNGKERVGLIATKPAGTVTEFEGSHWRQLSEINHEIIPHQVREWLTKPYVLTQALKRVCSDFCVKVKQEDVKPLQADEIAALGCYHNPNGYIRETYLGSRDNALVYARVTMPQSTYEFKRKDFENLGNRPIGESLLYNDPSVTRSGFEINRITLNDELLFDSEVHESFYKAMIEKSARLPELWARRSIFRLSGYPLLITEVFLANIPEYKV